MCNDWMLLCILGVFVGGWVFVGGLIAGVVALIGGALSKNKLMVRINICFGASWPFWGGSSASSICRSNVNLNRLSEKPAGVVILLQSIMVLFFDFGISFFYFISFGFVFGIVYFFFGELN